MTRSSSTPPVVPVARGSVPVSTAFGGVQNSTCDGPEPTDAP